jgi:hypothetical protein
MLRGFMLASAIALTIVGVGACAKVVEAQPGPSTTQTLTVVAKGSWCNVYKVQDGQNTVYFTEGRGADVPCSSFVIHNSQEPTDVQSEKGGSFTH